jgi:putative endonuclease
MKTGLYYVYITTNPGKTVLYVGITNDLSRRIFEHSENKGKPETFAGKYYCYKLLYYETYPDAKIAIAREKEIKNLTRAKKEELISNENPKWAFWVV